jgi:dienelactone hydrolase
MKVETYATMHHGWMGARANLSNADNLKEYERGYNQLAGFFAKYL